MRILEIDLRNCTGEETTLRHTAISEYVASFPDGPVCCLTLANGIRYDPVHTKLLIGRLRANDRFVGPSAVVGLEHLTKLVNVLNRLSGRSLRAFDDVESALAWLATTKA